MVSKKSVISIAKTQVRPTTDSAPRRSNWNAVSNDGRATTPLAPASAPGGSTRVPKSESAKSAAAVERRMPMRMAPRTLRTIKAAVTTSPKTAISATGSRTRLALKVTLVTGLARTRFACPRPITVRNRPMPAAMPRFKSGGMARKTASRAPASTSSTTTTPSSTMTPMAVCHDSPAPFTMPYATAAFSPMPAAIANG